MKGNTKMKYSKLALVILAALLTSAGAYAGGNEADVSQERELNTAVVVQQSNSVANSATIEQLGNNNLSTI